MSDIAFLTARPIAHRGLHDLNDRCWENTGSAFERAVARGFAIECDVNLSADGVPMVFHDSELERLTGEPGYVHERSAAELSRLAIGGTADRMLSLPEMLDLVGGRVPVVIEMKSARGHDGGMVAAVGEALSAYRGEAAIMSFDHRFVRAFAEQAPGVPAGLTAMGTKNLALEAHFAMLAHDLDFVSYDVKDLPNAFVGFVRARLGMPVITWTVKDRAAMAMTYAHADQITFEGFDPDEAPPA